MSVIPYFSSVPGMAVPGMIQPALAEHPSAGTWLYGGQGVLDYLDYIDNSTGHTLVATPGGYYTMMAVNSRAGLTVPPPDGRWDIRTVESDKVTKPSPAVQDDSVWYPPAHLAHLPPAVLALFAERELRARKRLSEKVVV